MPDDTTSLWQEPPPYERRFGWNVALPQPKQWKQDRKAIENVYAMQHTEARNQAHAADTRWAKLSSTERLHAWTMRGQALPTEDLTPWEQRASAHEAYQRTAIVLHKGNLHDFLPPTTFVEVERIPARLQELRGGSYIYRVWSYEYIGQGGDRHWPHPPGTARDVDELRAVIGREPNKRRSSFPTEVYTEDVALRHALRAHGIMVGQRFSPEMAQERRECYTVDAQHAVREAQSTRDWYEADWHDLTPRQQQAAYDGRGQGDTATLWEHRLAAQLKLARREQMIPYASRSGHQVPETFVEVEATAGRTAPYRVTRWTRVWDTDLGLTRYAHEAPQRVPTLEAVAAAAQDGQVPIFADTLGVRAQLRQNGFTVVAQEHVAMQRPSVERSQEHERGIGLGE